MKMVCMVVAGEVVAISIQIEMRSGNAPGYSPYHGPKIGAVPQIRIEIVETQNNISQASIPIGNR
jgi:hypothetical protein